MILITGGLGFIGTHTARTLLDMGESCVLVQRRAPELPDILADQAGRRVFAEQADLTDLAALLDVASRHKITGIVHLGGSMPWPPGADEPVAGARKAIDSLLNVLEAAVRWGVLRVGVASTIGVYGGTAAVSPVAEDAPLPIVAGPVIPAFKKVGELIGGYLADAAGLEVLNYRISGIWGPLGRPHSAFTAAPQLVHAAVTGTTPDLSGLHAPAYADDGSDLCYVRDCARGIALLQLADRLSHATYNVGSGRLTTNGEIAAAIRTAIPAARTELPDGHGPGGPGAYLDITRIQQDTGYAPAYDTERAAADYIDWLRAGHER